MSKEKVLMLGPGKPNESNSGLGVAANEIAKFLQKTTELTIIQVEELNKLGASENNTSTSSLKSVSQFSDFEVMSEMATISIQSTLEPYWYDQNIARNTGKKAIVSGIYKELEVFSDEMVTTADQLSFDVIYAHDWMTFMAAIELKKKTGKPLVLHVHSLDFDRSGKKTDSWVYHLEKDAFETADVIISVSEYSKTVMEQEYGVDADKIHVVHNGLKKKEYLEKSNPFPEKVVLFVGRLTGQKGAVRFLEIAEAVHEKYPNSRFIMAGEGDLYASMIESGAHSPIADRFHMTGYLDEPDLLKAYAMADVYCMPSVSEPFGLTALEAAGAELPIVVSKNAGVAEVLPDVLKAEYDDVDAFAMQIVKLLENEKEAKKYGMSNKEAVQDLGWEKPATQILNILAEI